MTAQSPIRLKAAAVLASLSLLLSGCFITPGKFTSELQLMEQDRFAFTYEGEIFFLALADLAAMGAANDTFEANCWDQETFEDRECTPEEETEQRAEWEAGAEARAAKNAKEAEQMAAIMGGINPNDPEASAELVKLLLRQKGWNSVEDMGDGVFEVSYSISGSLSHDFMFPVIEGFPTTNPFVQMIMRDGNVVRVNAPGFAAQNEGGPMGPLMGGIPGMAGLASLSEGENSEEKVPNVPTIEGTFTIVTSGTIRANNTDEGSNPTPNGESLTWNISPRTKAAPTALIDMSR
ncbi:MAG: hypothetical protein QNJ15_05335 [Erythrobacter sp.]|nr:hypothetical protein [Erythrobacter sp.]